jgi:hypothetical protein
MLAPQKVTKEEGTQPSRPKGSLALLNKISRSRNSTWQLTQNVSYCGIRTVAPSPLILSPLLSVMGWDLSRQTHTASMWTVLKTDSFLKITSGGAHRCSGSPSAAPSNAGLTGVFGHRLSEFRNKPRSVWLVRASFDGRPANRVAQETSGSWGVLFFAFFLMDKHKKEWSPKRRNSSIINSRCASKEKQLAKKAKRNLP